MKLRSLGILAAALATAGERVFFRGKPVVPEQTKPAKPTHQAPGPFAKSANTEPGYLPCVRMGYGVHRNGKSWPLNGKNRAQRARLFAGINQLSGRVPTRDLTLPSMGWL